MTPDDQSTPSALVPSGTSPAQGPLPDLLLPAALFRPLRYLRPSDALPHLPLLVWLVETLRPRQVLSLGLGDGVAYLAVCQAMERHEGGCVAILPEAAPVPAEIADHHDRNYRDLSRLIPAPDGVHWAGTETYFPASTVDLVLVPAPDAQTLRALAESDRQRLLPDHAVIVLCGGDHATGPADAPDLWPDRPRMHLDAGMGHGAAGITLIGPDPLLAPLRGPLQGVLQRLGAALAFESEIGTARADIAAARAACTIAEARAADLDARHEVLTQAYAERSGLLARLQADLFDLRTMSEEHADLQRRLDAAQAEVDTRYREIAALTHYVEARTRSHKAQIEKLSATLTDTIRATELAPLAHRLHEAEAATTALLNSTSWRITAPFRAIVLALRRR